MKVTLWGTRGSVAAPGAETARYGGNTACVEVRGADDTVLILDAGTGIRRLGTTLSPSVRRVNILLTHLHMDHLQGLGFFAPLYNPAVEVHIWGPASPTLSLEKRLMRYLSPPLFPVRLRELPCRLFLHEVPCKDFDVGEFHISSSLICHPGPTVGYRITTARAKFAYLTDHEPTLGVPRFPLASEWTSGYALAANVNLLIHDAQYSNKEYTNCVGWGHSTMQDAIAFAALAAAKHLVLFHHDPTHTDEDLDRLTAEAIAVAQPTLSCHVGCRRFRVRLGLHKSFVIKRKRMARPDLHHIKRKLTAILHADVAGYSRLMSADEETTLQTLHASRTITDSLIAQHQGRIVGTAGDSILAEFASVVEAVQCAVEIQQALKTRNSAVPPEQRMEFRIGINLGDVMVEGEQIYGEGVNIAARLESLADPGGIHLSGTAYDQVKNKLSLGYNYLGEQTVKNIPEPVRVYRVGMEEAERQKVEDSASQKAKVKEQKSKVKNKISSAHRSRTMLIAAGLLIAVGILAFPFLSPLITHHSSLVTEKAQPSSLPLPDKPSIVVLPFVNMSKDPDQDYFSDGMTEDLTTALSQIASLFVIARNSAFTYKGKAVKVQEVSRELGVQYVLEGSVRKANNQVRITAQLMDAPTGSHIWAERYDRPLKDIFALQDEIVQQIVTTLKLQLTLQEHGINVRKHTNNLEAYDAFLRGMEDTRRSTKESNTQARQRFQRAIDLDPTYAEVYAWLSYSYWLEWYSQWSRDPQILEQAFALAQRALVLDDSLPVAHSVLGLAYMWKKQHDQAIAEGERAVALAPNNADSLVWLARILVYVGRAEEAIRLAQQAMRLNPHYPPLYILNLGIAYHYAWRNEEAIATLKRYLIYNRDHISAHTGLACSYSDTGREEEARAEAAEILRLSPQFSLETWSQSLPVRDPKELERHVNNARKAGLK